MHITLVGMSNIGKTYWADRLVAEAGFEKIDCDALIEERLGGILTRLGYQGIRDVAKWMGQPYAPQYPETSRQFIECEQAVMQTIIDRLSAAQDGKPIVVDATGSVIYAGASILEPIKTLTRVIYLEASPAHRAELFERYIKEPKPVVWGDNAFVQRPGESEQAALARCYPGLLESRGKRYAAMAQAVIPFARHKAATADTGLLLVGA